MLAAFEPVPMRRALPLILALAAAAPASAQSFPGTEIVELSRGAATDARNPAISQDKRWARLAAFDGEVAGQREVFVVARAEGYGDDGSPWQPTTPAVVSVAPDGSRANGPSYGPSLDGTSRVAPHCVAFVSAASNLVPGDTNGKPDAFVRDLRTGRTTRVSVSSTGRQSSGTVTEVAVNGLCTRVAFVSDAGDLALRRTRNRSWKSAVTGASPAGRRQVYIRAIGGTTGLDRALNGLTFLASASDRGVPANGDSFEVAFATSSRAIVFTTLGTNVSASDGNAEADVYQRVMTRKYLPKIKGRSAQTLQMDTRLISGGAGAGDQPATNVDGSVLAYRTGGQIMQVRPAAGTTKLVSRTDAGTPGSGPSGAPTLTAGGTWVIFESAAPDVGDRAGRKPDDNGVSDIILFTEVSAERWILGERGADRPAADPMASPHGNYVVFERDGRVLMNYVGPK